MKPMLTTFWVMGTVLWALFVGHSFLTGAAWYKEYLLLTVYTSAHTHYSSAELIGSALLLAFGIPAIVYLLVWMVSEAGKPRRSA